MSPLILSLASGSKANCTLVSDGQTHILIDFGLSCRKINERLARYGLSLDSISAVFLTHEHSDHVTGLEMLCKKYHIPVYLNTASARSISSGGRCPNLSGCMKILDAGGELFLNDLQILPFRTPHDACGDRKSVV